MKNQPYVKIYENGVLTNPITDRYDSGNSLRKLNRGHERYVKHRTRTNLRNEPLVVFQQKTKRGVWITTKILN